MKVLRRVRNRAGRCYELCFKAMLHGGPEVEGARLVHGTYGDQGQALGHAWIQLADGRVYDATADEYFAPDEYARLACAVAERTYTLKEAAALASSSGHSGPWHETNGETRDATKPKARKP